MKLPSVFLLVALVWSPVAAHAKEKAVKPRDQLRFGVKMAERGLWSEALFRFRQAERMGDESAAVLNNIAVAYEALGQFDRAQNYYQRALDRDPRNDHLRRNYSRFVEFYQSFKPDETEGDRAEGEDGDEGAGDSRATPASSAASSPDRV